ncbi:MAG: hypothetical protein QOG23_1442 [Blastocatellia bacterium]|nr:hypothetical protein [Blastocatellia bacterium]
MWNDTTSKQRILKCAAAVLYVFCLILIGVRQSPAQTNNAQVPQPTEARILLTAVDNNGRFVSTLRADDLSVLVDGVPQKIDGFRRLTDRLLSLAILIDTSGSQERTLPGQKLAANSFVDFVFRPGMDRAAIATFTGTFTLEQKLTQDVTLLHQAIERVKFIPPQGYIGGGIVVSKQPPISTSAAAAAGSTALWDAVIAACDEALSQSTSETRRGIILLSDGQDTFSKNKMSAAVDRAVRDDVVIYGIGIGDKAFGVNKDGLRKLTERTGGRSFFPTTVGELTGILAEIGLELRTQYSITYSPPNGQGSSGKIRIEIVNPDLRKAEVRLFYQQSVPRK